MKKSRIVKRSIRVGGHSTSVSVEQDFWIALKEIAGRRPISKVITSIDEAREYGNLS